MSDGASGAFIAWLDAASGHSRLLRIDGAGTPSAGWPADGIDVAGVSAQVIANPVSDGAGGVILFAGGAFAGARAFRFDPSGTVPSSWPAAGREVLPSLTAPGQTRLVTQAISDGLGGAFLLLTTDQTSCPGHDCSSSTTLRAVRIMFDGTASPFWPRTLASWTVSNSSFCCLLSANAIADGSGGMVALVSDDYRGSSRVIHFDASGVQQESRAAPNQIEVCGGRLPGGDYLVAMGDNPFSGLPDLDVHLYRMTPSLSDAPGWPAAGVTLGESSVAEHASQLIPDGGSGAFVISRADPPGASSILRAQHVSGSPPPVTTLWPVPGAPMPDWSSPSIAIDGIGGLVSTGYDFGTQTLRALHLDATGQPATGMSPSGVTLASPPSSSFRPPSTTNAGPGGVIVVWSEQRAGDWNVYAQRLPLANAVSTVVAGASAEPVADGVRVTWWLEDGLASTLLVERSVGNGAWQPLGSVSDVGFDHAVYLDHAVSSGRRYAYRLRVTGAEAPLVGSEVSMDYGPRLANMLVGFVPSPAVGSPRVLFQLAGGMTELQILDIAGRLVARHDVSGLASGSHELSTGRLAPGLYTIRLIGPSGTRMTRGVVLR